MAGSRPINDYFNSENVQMVRIYVGKEREPWTLPEELLCEFDYFRAAFRSGFKEGVEKQIHLAEDDPSTFLHLVDYLFQGEIKPHNFHQDEVQLQLCKLWVIAKKLGIGDLAGDARSELIYELTLSSCDPAAVTFVYENMPDAGELQAIFARGVAKQMLCAGTAENKYIENWAKATSCDSTFNLEVEKEINLHLRDGSKDCDWGDSCKAHWGQEQ